MSLDAKQMTGAPPVAADPSTPTYINHWPTLSDEIVLMILRHLPLKELVKVSLINKKFRDFSRDDSLWTELTLDYEDIKQNAESCRKLVERCKKLASLKISNESKNWKPLNIMTVVIRAKETLKSGGRFFHANLDTCCNGKAWPSEESYKSHYVVSYGDKCNERVRRRQNVGRVGKFR